MFWWAYPANLYDERLSFVLHYYVLPLHRYSVCTWQASTKMQELEANTKGRYVFLIFKQKYMTIYRVCLWWQWRCANDNNRWYDLLQESYWKTTFYCSMVSEIILFLQLMKMIEHRHDIQSRLLSQLNNYECLITIHKPRTWPYNTYIPADFDTPLGVHLGLLFFEN